MKKQEFTVTRDHLTLLKEMYVGWNDCEFGAPTISCKRPYGNSNVYSDINEALGHWNDDCDEDGEFSDDACAQMLKVHQEMKTVLQILLQNPLKFDTGVYESDLYSSDWTKKRRYRKRQDGFKIDSNL